MKLVSGIAEEFRISFTVAALRFAELYKGAMAVILSKNKRIVWMAWNKNFAYGKLNKNELIPLDTRTYDVYEQLMPTNYIMNKRIKKLGFKQVNKEKADYSASLEKTVTVSSTNWFGNNRSADNGYLSQIDFPMMNMAGC